MRNDIINKHLIYIIAFIMLFACSCFEDYDGQYARPEDFNSAKCDPNGLTITSISPSNSFYPGDTIIIYGSGFTTEGDIWYSGMFGQMYTFVSSTEISVKIRDDLPSGVFDLQATVGLGPAYGDITQWSNCVIVDVKK